MSILLYVHILTEFNSYFDIYDDYMLFPAFFPNPSPFSKKNLTEVVSQEPKILGISRTSGPNVRVYIWVANSASILSCCQYAVKFPKAIYVARQKI